MTVTITNSFRGERDKPRVEIVSGVEGVDIRNGIVSLLNSEGNVIRRMGLMANNISVRCK